MQEKKHGMKRKQYIFTNKKVSPISVTSVSLGIIALVSMLLAVFLSFKRGGEAPIGYGFTVIAALFLSIGGIAFAVKARLEKDMFYVFAYAGMAINGMNLFFIMYILGLGIMEM